MIYVAENPSKKKAPIFVAQNHLTSLALSSCAGYFCGPKPKQESGWGPHIGYFWVWESHIGHQSPNLGLALPQKREAGQKIESVINLAAEAYLLRQGYQR